MKNSTLKDIADKALWQKGVDTGEELEQTRIRNYAEHRICFDNKAGSCEHSACYALQDLIIFLEQK